MNKYKNSQLIEHLSLILVLSFFFIKNIYLVLIGIILALYKLNEKFLSKLTILLEIKKSEKENIIIDTSIKKNNETLDEINKRIKVDNLIIRNLIVKYKKLNLKDEYFKNEKK